MRQQYQGVNYQGLLLTKSKCYITLEIFQMSECRYYCKLDTRLLLLLWDM